MNLEKSGFTLLQSLIALSVVMIGVVAVMNLSGLLGKQQLSVHQLDQFMQVIYQSRTLLNSGHGCTFNFEGKEFNPKKPQSVELQFPPLGDEIGRVLVKSGDRYRGLKFTNILLQPESEIRENYYWASLVIEAKRSDSGLAHLSSMKRTQLLHVFTEDREDKKWITHCYGEGVEAFSCSQIGGDFDPSKEVGQKCKLTRKICQAIGVEYDSEKKICLPDQFNSKSMDQMMRAMRGTQFQNLMRQFQNGFKGK